MSNQMFVVMEYSSIYCKMDCEVRMDGYGVFRSWMVERIGLHFDHYITIQSLASGFVLSSGYYDNVFQISGVLQQDTARSVVGGRCVTAKK